MRRDFELVALPEVEEEKGRKGDGEIWVCDMKFDYFKLSLQIHKNLPFSPSPFLPVSSSQLKVLENEIGHHRVEMFFLH